MKIGQRPSRQSLTKYEDVLLFGRHKGKTVEYILEHDPSYLVWLDDEKVAIVSQEIYNTAEQYAAEEDEDYFDLGSSEFWGVDLYDFMDD